ncbi:MAG: bifunctional UDP-N-acetylglucosamine diphosphorylase/glucosamine-1-phosphate N-acetyltransferase GlmU [Actinomycetota bacterium]|nr:bifunctional UDP-N-acetylglucosamine diphosphorylase/glucosamine-1-phosphate N-acetyltransferase GlmU [Actinomycetota bacterium]
MNVAVIVLAAGEGTRMKSSMPKALHAICGRPMLHFVLVAAEALHPKKVVVVVGHKAEQVKEAVQDVDFALQEEQLGTGHAVLAARDSLAGFVGTIVILSGDTPLITAETLCSLLDTHHASGASASILSARLRDPHGYGRIVRAEDGSVAAIVEEKDATDDERLIDETNSGIYCFDAEKLYAALGQVGADNEQREYYLTDVIKILREQGEKVTASIAADADEIAGVNSRVQLAFADNVMRRRVNEGYMLRGVTIIESALTFITPGAQIGVDTVVYPMTFIDAETTIGEGCVVGPSSRLKGCKIGDNTTIDNSIVLQSIIEDDATIGPFAHIRPGTHVKTGAKVGGFVEIKNSELGIDSKVPHLSYIGDAQIGDYVNIGAGTITCNYDGFEKYRTVVEDGAFVGSDTMLVAPVKVGKGSFTGAGSVISKDVPADSLAIERSEQRTIGNWAKKRRKKQDGKTSKA